jgi:hypothetical protein
MVYVYKGITRMIETSTQVDNSAVTTVFVVVQLSPRRWAIGEQASITRPNGEFRIISKSFNNRIDAHQVCSELAGKPREEYSELTREHLLDSRHLRGNTTPRSRLWAGWKN